MIIRTNKYYLLILLAAFIVGGCGNFSGNYDEIESSASSESTTTTTDTTAPVIAEVTAVTTPTNDSTPNYTFSSDEAGTITYGGSCSSSTTSATSGNNTITFLTLSDGTYSDCTIIVTDSDGNESNTLTITAFTVTYLRLNIDFGAADPDVPSSYAGAANQSGTWNKISSNSTNNLVEINNVSTSISLEVTAWTLGGSSGSGANLTADNFYSKNGDSWKVEITGFSNGIYDIYYYAPAHYQVSTGSFYINSALQNSISGSGNNELSQGTDWGMLSGVTVSNSTLTLESNSTSGYRGLAGLQIRPTQ